MDNERQDATFDETCERLRAESEPLLNEQPIGSATVK